MRLLSIALAVAALWVTGCRNETGADGGAVVARWRFRGTEALGNVSGAPQLKTVVGLPEAALVTPKATTNLTDRLVERLTGATNASLAAQLRPLVQALIRHESAGEITAEGWSLAVRVPAAESAGVQNSVLSIPRMEGQGAGLPVAQYTNGWLTAGSTAAWAGRAARLPALANDGLLSGDFDIAAIAKADPKRWPRAHLDFVATNGLVRTSGRLAFAAPPMGDLPEWKIPDTFIHDPIIQFAAVRGIDQLVADNEWFRVLSGGKVPAQLSMWAQPDVSFRIWFGAPVDDGMGRIPRIQEALKAHVSTNAPVGQYMGITLLNSNKSAVAVYNPGGPKGILPSIGVAKQGAQDFLVTSIIHASKDTNAMPAELLQELKKPDLVYYDWEITAEGIPHWNVLFQYNNLVRGVRANALLPRAHNWMLAAASKLGNSVTSVRRVSPTEFELARNSGCGLTSLELVLLTRFLDGPIVDLKGITPPPAPGAPAIRR